MSPENLLAQLRAMKWKKTWNRKNVSDNGCYSMVFGITRVPFSGYCYAVNNEKYPELYKSLIEFAKTYFPSFQYTSITINKNLQCKPHKDKSNKGPTIIVGLGNYEGGEFIVGDIQFDIKNKMCLFDGANMEHYTMPFTGERYTLVYYSCN